MKNDFNCSGLRVYACFWWKCWSCAEKKIYKCIGVKALLNIDKYLDQVDAERYIFDWSVQAGNTYMDQVNRQIYLDQVGRYAYSDQAYIRFILYLG